LLVQSAFEPCPSDPIGNSAAGWPEKSSGKTSGGSLRREPPPCTHRPSAIRNTGPGFDRYHARYASDLRRRSLPYGPHGLQQKASDYPCIPLCVEHHRGGNAALDKIGRLAFEAKFNLRIGCLVQQLHATRHTSARSL
jgi:hypothetical protein